MSNQSSLPLVSFPRKRRPRRYKQEQPPRKYQRETGGLSHYSIWSNGNATAKTNLPKNQEATCALLKKRWKCSIRTTQKPRNSKKPWFFLPPTSKLKGKVVFTITTEGRRVDKRIRDEFIFVYRLNYPCQAHGPACRPNRLRWPTK